MHVAKLQCLPRLSGYLFPHKILFPRPTTTTQRKHDLDGDVAQNLFYKIRYCLILNVTLLSVGWSMATSNQGKVIFWRPQTKTLHLGTLVFIVCWKSAWPVATKQWDTMGEGRLVYHQWKLLRNHTNPSGSCRRVQALPTESKAQFRSESSLPTHFCQLVDSFTINQNYCKPVSWLLPSESVSNWAHWPNSVGMEPANAFPSIGRLVYHQSKL